MEYLPQAIMIGILAGLAGVDLFDGLIHFHRPIVTGPIVGLILGDFQTGLIAGGTLELVWAGMVPLAGAQPPNVVIGGIIGTAFTILSNQNPTLAVGIAIPFAIAAQAGITFLFTVFTPVMHKMDEFAENADTSGIDRWNYIGLAILFVSYFLVAFLPIAFGGEQATAIVQSIPEWVINGLKTAGGIMPAVGFAMLMKIMFKWTYAPFYFAGFVMVAYLNMPILAIAIVAATVAGYDYFRDDDVVHVSGKAIVRDEEDYSDGI